VNLLVVLEDENVLTRRRNYIDNRKKIQNDISKQDLHIAKARKFFLDEKIDLDDFSKLKMENRIDLTHFPIFNPFNIESMNQLTYKNPRAFSVRKVSVDQAIKLLRRNSIRVIDK